MRVVVPARAERGLGWRPSSYPVTMSWPAWFFRIVPYLGRRRAGEDLEQEMRLHVELKRDRLVDVGVAPDAAAHAARRRHGNPALIREDTRCRLGGGAGSTASSGTCAT